MRLRRLAGLAFAVGLFVLAGSTALGVLVALSSNAIEQLAVYVPHPGDPGHGLGRFDALRLLAWPTPAPTATTLPPPPAEGDGARPAEIPARLADPGPVAASEGDVPPPVIREYQDFELAGAVLASVNGARAAQGLPALSASGSLMTAAQGYALLLTQASTLSHDLEGGLVARVQASGYPGGRMGEALWEGWGSYGPDQIVNDWLNSPPHRAILLGASYAEAGIGCYVLMTGGESDTRCVLDVGG